MIVRLQKGSVTLLSKGARDFIATTVGEAGLNCAIAELNYDAGFRTHWYYKGGSSPLWKSPVKKREPAVSKYDDFATTGVQDGVYKGTIGQGEFKLKCAPFYGAKENPKTVTLIEKELFVRVEIVSHIGEGKTSDAHSYRRITALLEKRNPAAENLLFDGEMLDLGLGPYANTPNQLRQGRLYGYYQIDLSLNGPGDRGSALFQMEKIESPGMISAETPTRIEFPGKSITLDKGNDSSKQKKFDPLAGYLLDGPHGAHPIKLTHLQQDRILAKAKRAKNSGGFVIEKNTFPESKYQNPYDPKTKFYDLNFGGYYCKDSPTDTGGGGGEEPDNGEDETDSSAAPGGGDDPGPIAAVRGKKLLIYSKVPLRIWGCPDRTVTIFSEGDIVIGGDFNQNPLTMQDYADNTYMTYATPLMNGKGGNKVGALIMSMGRILIDTSRPSLFAANELRPYFLFALGETLHPSTEEFRQEMREAFCPLDPEKRKGIVGLGGLGPDGVPIAKYGTIAWLYNNPSIEAGPAYDANVADLIDFFTPGGGGGKPKFGINDPASRTLIIQEVIDACRKGGDLSREELDRITKLAWDQAIVEENESPQADCGVMGLMNGLFDEANKSVKDGIFMPEITINAALVSSSRRAALWSRGNSGPKIPDEIGNAPGGSSGICEYLKKPRFLIQRLYGADIRLGTGEPTYFIDGKYTGTNVLRRRIWDAKLISNPTYKPLEFPFAFNLLNYTEETITRNEFEKF
jgi:hypothetical protein